MYFNYLIFISYIVHCNTLESNLSLFSIHIQILLLRILLQLHIYNLNNKIITTTTTTTTTPITTTTTTTPVLDGTTSPLTTTTAEILSLLFDSIWQSESVQALLSKLIITTHNISIMYNIKYDNINDRSSSSSNSGNDGSSRSKDGDVQVWDWVA